MIRKLFRNVWNMIWPMMLIVVSNCFYNICAKSTPENVNTFGSLTANICVAIALIVIGFLLYKETVSPRQVLGIVVCGIGLF